MGGNTFSEVKSNRTKCNGLKLCQWRFISDISKNFSPESVVSHWNGLSSEVVKPPSLEAFEIHADMMLRNKVYWWIFSAEFMVGLNDPN